MTLIAVAVMTAAAGASGVLLLGDSPAHEGSPVPAASLIPSTRGSAEQHIRQACGDDAALTEGAHMCLARASLSPSELAAFIERLRDSSE